jgi:hypothetical protein
MIFYYKLCVLRFGVEMDVQEGTPTTPIQVTLGLRQWPVPLALGFP